MLRKLPRGLLVTVAFILAAGSAFGQQPTPSPTAAIDSDDGKDDVLLIVRLTAKELKFETIPNTTVVFPGTHKRATAWLTERQNLPEKLEPGVTYRDIGIKLRIASRFEDVDQIVREALREDTPAGAAKPAAAGSLENQALEAKKPVVRSRSDRPGKHRR